MKKTEILHRIITSLKKDEIEHLNTLLLESEKTCKKKKFNPFQYVYRDEDVSIVDTTRYTQSVIRKIKPTKIDNYTKTQKHLKAYQFVNTYFCDRCNDYHIKDIVQIYDKTFKKHSKDIQSVVKNALKPSERRKKNVKVKSMNKVSLSKSEKSILANFRPRQL